MLRVIDKLAREERLMRCGLLNMEKRRTRRPDKK